MKVNYKYNGPSVLLPKDGSTTLGLSPDLSRSEVVSFHGRLKNPLIFRDAMLMLREIVISNSEIEVKPREEFFVWLDSEIERRVYAHKEYVPGIRKSLEGEMDTLSSKIFDKDSEINRLLETKRKLSKQIDSYDAWKDYYNLERKFWSFLKNRDLDLWFVLDPVITVHPDIVSFEAFSLDESIYGCLSIEMDEFEMIGEPKLGTTNIDFSAKLAKSLERFRTYSNVELSVNPDGFIADSGTVPQHIEKKIDLPESWVKGFTQVSSAAYLDGLDIELAPVDLYDICSFLRRHKENESPRYMKWSLEKNKPIKITFEPFGICLTLTSKYLGENSREEKIWGRRRWLVAEKLIPLAKSFKIKLLGFGMPQFIIADLGKMKMTIGFSSWSANDWVKGTAFNIMGGFIGEGDYDEAYQLLKTERFVNKEDLFTKIDAPKSKAISGIGSLFKRGEGYFDPINNKIRFRKLFSEPIPEALYKSSDIELQVKSLIDENMENFSIELSDSGHFIFKNKYKILNERYHNYKYRQDKTYNEKYAFTDTGLQIDEDGQIAKLTCTCREFNKGPRNISAPCAHILALYAVSAKFTRLGLEHNREYKINDVMEMLL
ncbi:MAG: SWIM zinc finger domain-containing protein [Clostridiales bacterium]|nr:SWIM zinc finger domain-containing protein [Clostridiales bacterium]